MNVCHSINSTVRRKFVGCEMMEKEEAKPTSLELLKAIMSAHTPYTVAATRHSTTHIAHSTWGTNKHAVAHFGEPMPATHISKSCYQFQAPKSNSNHAAHTSTIDMLLTGYLTIPAPSLHTTAIPAHTCSATRPNMSHYTTHAVIHNSTHSQPHKARE